MVRNYIRKTSRASYGSSSLSAALEAMKNGQPLKAASRAYGVPTKTLRWHRDAKALKPVLPYKADTKVSFQQNMSTC